MLTPSESRKIIANADDFGLNDEVNQAIVEAFEKHMISSATLMANMPGFEEACELAHRHGLLGRIGVHLNLTEGFPLSTPIRRCSRLCDESGALRSRQTWFRLTKEERIAIETEIAAQVTACLDRGLIPTHMDSHHHVHTEWAVGSAAIDVARQYGIKAIRLSRNCGPGISFIHKLYKWLYNTRLRMYSLAKTRYFGSASDVQDVLATKSGDIEIMVHPTASGIEKAPDGSPNTRIDHWFSTLRLTSYP
jgi:predicted glycoside hydrolase/deacetylase ChbG (UPF0249 family)